MARVGQEVAQVGADRPRPVDVGRAGPAGPAGPGQRTTNRLAGAVCELLLELGEHAGDDLTRRRPRLLGQRPVELDEQRDEVQIRLELAEQLRFEQQLAEVEPLDGVALEDLDDGRREVTADVAQPPGHRRRGSAESGGPARASAGRDRAVVERTEGLVDALVVAGQANRRPIGVTAAEDEPPPTQPLRLETRRSRACCGRRRRWSARRAERVIRLRTTRLARSDAAGEGAGAPAVPNRVIRL